MPFYNNEKYLEEALLSVLNCTLEQNQFEIIVVNDGSEDNSVNIVQSFASKYGNIKLYHHPTNLGPAKALKTCLEYCSGEYILFTAADDISFPDRAERCLEVFQKNPNVGMVISEAVIINENSELTNELYRVPEYINKSNIALDQLKRNYCLGATISIKNDFSILGKSNILEHADDYELSLEYILAGYDIEVIRAPLVKYRVHLNSVSNNKSLLYKNTVKAIKRFLSSDFEINLLKRQFSLLEVYIALGIFNMFRGHLEEGLNYLDKSASIIEHENVLTETTCFELYFYLGVSCYVKTQYFESYQWFSKAAEINRDDPTLLNNLAVLHFLLNRDSELSLIYLEKSLKKQPNYIDAKNNKEAILKSENNLKVTERILGKSLIQRDNYII